MKDLFETQQKFEDKFTLITSRLDGAETNMGILTSKLTGVDANVAALTQKFDAFLKLHMESAKGKEQAHQGESSTTQTPFRGDFYSPPYQRGPQQQFHHHQQHDHFSRPARMEFPEFSGDPRLWIRRANRYFSFHPTDELSKVKFASYYMVGQADLWFMEYVEGKQHVPWEHFTTILLNRFLVPGHDDIVIEFTQLAQKTDVLSYIEQFEELKSLVKAKHPYLGEEFLILCFLKGLKDELRSPVQLFKPVDLTQAMTQAKQMENTLEIWGKRSKFPYKPSPFHPKSASSALPSSIPSVSSGPLVYKIPRKDSLSPPFWRLSRAQIQEKREKGLCFTCDEKYSASHICKDKHLNIIIAEDDSVDHFSEWDSIPADLDGGEISIHSLNDNRTRHSMKLKGKCKGREISILIDSGSTHSYLNTFTASELQCIIEETPPWVIIVANGEKTVSKEKCSHFTWSMHGHSFEAELRLIPFGGCDIMLGHDWMWSYDPVTFHLKKNCLDVTKDGRKLQIQGVDDGASLRLMSSKGFSKMFKKTTQGIVAHLFAIEADPSPHPPPPIIQELLDDFTDIFQEPSGLPPVRNFEHQIQLLPGALPVQQKPYRYSHVLKDAIEKMVTELLHQDLIQPSSSPFAAPVLLVKKKDFTWRLCVDYMKLNEITIKDKFPMPVIEELLSELHGACVFSKIDLRQGYFQVRLHTADRHKSAFVTHHG